MIITNSRYALVGYFITLYPTRAHGITDCYIVLALYTNLLSLIHYHFLQVLRFSSLHKKINTSKFLFDLGTVDEEPFRGNATANSHLFLFIYLFILFIFKPEKNSDLNGIGQRPLRYRCSALPTELSSQLGAGHFASS